MVNHTSDAHATGASLLDGKKPEWSPTHGNSAQVAFEKREDLLHVLPACKHCTYVFVLIVLQEIDLSLEFKRYVTFMIPLATRIKSPNFHSVFVEREP